jgi:hypothetical protein
MNKLQKGFATVLATLGILGSQVLLFPISRAHAAQQLYCNGQMNNGWTYSATFLDGRFTQIRWQRSGQPPQISELTYDTENDQGQPIYRGSFQGATAVTLVDLSGGGTRPGSQVSVGVEEWGWSTGTCGVSSSERPSNTINLDTLNQQLRGLEPSEAANQLRGQNFFFVQTLEHTERQIIERWDRQADNSSIQVVYTNNRVSTVKNSQ